ncbi:hypothetical protein FGO68_gene13671 [Halteria grandinella]|uniref:Uncharacterized protein n=1 Tax=Halteria grandinella TaxID=5974 RepID=A0A8J8NAR4_HALGN|nr:hypothetical protein FGO68_gene13671 [Halteria grandinella]
MKSLSIDSGEISKVQDDVLMQPSLKRKTLFSQVISTQSLISNFLQLISSGLSRYFYTTKASVLTMFGIFSRFEKFAKFQSGGTLLQFRLVQGICCCPAVFTQAEIFLITCAAISGDFI